VKFTPKGGHVEIRIAQIDSTVRITVQDNGIGIKPEFLPHLFERFRQFDSTTTRIYGGLGLGLAIVRYLVEQHGGHVSATSDGLGKGAKFSIDLPVRAIMQPEQSTDEPLEGRELSKKPLTGLRMLVVEDENDSRDLILTVLTSAGASGIGVSSAEEALSEIYRQAPDAIVSDIAMPFKNGYVFIRELRSRSEHQKIPAVALTAYAREEDRLQALEAGFDMHVPKPIDPAELVTRIVQVVGR
jgi:CheY-like chemotaxis protein